MTLKEAEVGYSRSFSTSIQTSPWSLCPGTGLPFTGNPEINQGYTVTPSRWFSSIFSPPSNQNHCHQHHWTQRRASGFMPGKIPHSCVWGFSAQWGDFDLTHGSFTISKCIPSSAVLHLSLIPADLTVTFFLIIHFFPSSFSSVQSETRRVRRGKPASWGTDVVA